MDVVGELSATPVYKERSRAHPIYVVLEKCPVLPSIVLGWYWGGPGMLLCNVGVDNAVYHSLAAVACSQMVRA